LEYANNNMVGDKGKILVIVDDVWSDTVADKKKVGQCFFANVNLLYFSHSSKRIDHFKEWQRFALEKPHKLLYPSQTRWQSLNVRPKVPIYLSLGIP
jgi:hypothetical protein